LDCSGHKNSGIFNEFTNLESIKFKVPIFVSSRGASLDAGMHVSSYIGFSQTVEECTRFQYNMTTDDDVFLKRYNQDKLPTAQCSEDDFEMIMETLESSPDLQTPTVTIQNVVLEFVIVSIT
jgi:hypothetical protein